jgi:hypothetical protein
MGNRGIVKPETFLRLPETPANHVFEIVDADYYVRVEGIDIVHRDKPGRHAPASCRITRIIYVKSS